MTPRLRALLIAIALILACGLWLFLVRDPSLDAPRWFGIWRTRHVLVAVALIWLSALAFLRSYSLAALRRGLVSSFGVAIAIGVLEVAGLTGGVSFPRVFGHVHGDTLGAKPVPNQDLRGQTTGDIAAGWGVEKHEVEFHYKTDHRGFRNAHDREAADVYLVGDSILVAGLIPFDQTVTGILETRLGVPVMNIALIGLSPQEELALFRNAKVPLEGRFVIHFLFEGNDLIDSQTFRSREHGLDTAAPSILDRSFLHNLELWLMHRTQPVHPHAARYSGDIDGTTYYFAYSARTMRNHDEELPFIAEALGEMRDEVARAGGEYAVVFVPSKLRVLGPSCRWPPGSALQDYRDQLSPLPAFLERWSRENDVPYIDTTPYLAARVASGDIPFFATDTHPDASGHSAFAAAILGWRPFRDWLRDRGSQ